MSNAKELVSVIIPTVNAHEELDLAIASIIKNSDNNIDLVVVVDPDRATGKVNKDIVAACSRYGVKPIINKENNGPYGSWNVGAKHAKSDWLIFATDDQYFAPHWDSNLLKYYQPKRLIAGRLVEPGIIPVWRTNIQMDFGSLPSEFKEKAFNAWCADRVDTGFVQDGFFIPMLQHRRDYLALGGYKVVGEFGTSSAVSSDIQYVEDAVKKGYQFGTAADSYSYHFQASSWKKKSLKPSIAAVILTRNEEKYLPDCLKSLAWVSEIYVVDSGSTDKTLEIAKKAKASIVKHTFTNFTDQRNVALRTVAAHDWVLMIDADETVDSDLAVELQSFAKDIYLDGVEIPRKNKVFGKYLEHTDWYPDYRLVFMRPKMVQYQGDVHERAVFIKGNGTTVRAHGHILHQNYETVREFVVKNLVDYPATYACVMTEQGEKFSPVDVFVKPVAEFMRRYFLSEGYKDGMHGFVLSSLMAAQTLVAYVYLWEMQGKRADMTTSEIRDVFRALRGKSAELTYWLTTMVIESSTGAKKLLHRAQRKALKMVKGL